MTLEVKTMSVVVKPVGAPIFSEEATTISIVDEAAGEFVVVSQSVRDNIGKIAINPEEWTTIRAAIDMMIKACK